MLPECIVLTYGRREFVLLLHSCWLSRRITKKGRKGVSIFVCLSLGFQQTACHLTSNSCAIYLCKCVVKGTRLLFVYWSSVYISPGLSIIYSKNALPFVNCFPFIHRTFCTAYPKWPIFFFFGTDPSPVVHTCRHTKFILVLHPCLVTSDILRGVGVTYTWDCYTLGEHQCLF